MLAEKEVEDPTESVVVARVVVPKTVSVPCEVNVPVAVIDDPVKVYA